MTEDRDKWRKYTSMVWPTLESRTAEEQNRTTIRLYELQVNKTETKLRSVEVRQSSMQHLSKKTQYSCSLCRKVVQIHWLGEVGTKCLLIAFFLGNKDYHNRFLCEKVIARQSWNVFGTQCTDFYCPASIGWHAVICRRLSSVVVVCRRRLSSSGRVAGPAADTARRDSTVTSG